jgi:hypothetical protein
MKRTTLIAITVLSLGTAPVLAQQQDRASQPQGVKTMGGQVMRPGVMAGKGRNPMLRRLQALRGGVDEILNTDDPAERRELLETHRDKLDEAIAVLETRRGEYGGMHGNKSSHGKHHGMKGGHGKGRHHDDDFHQRVEKRLELIQALLEQVLEYQIEN